MGNTNNSAGHVLSLSGFLIDLSVRRGAPAARCRWHDNALSHARPNHVHKADRSHTGLPVASQVYPNLSVALNVGG